MEPDESVRDEVESPRVPGETVPAATRRTLDRPPSERYGVDTAAPEPSGSFAGAVVAALVAALAGGALLVVFASPLAMSEPLVLVALAVGVVAGRGTRWGGGTVVHVPRRRAIASIVVLLVLASAQVVIWRLAIGEGGVLPLVDYLLTVFGPVVPLELVVGTVAAWAAA
jgi:hypothetical protein